jgi:hypothetical protein
MKILLHVNPLLSIDSINNARFQAADSYNAPIEWLDSSVLCFVYDHGCARSYGYSNRGTVFSMLPVPRCCKQDN